jgi:hypothetical protein
LKLLDIIYIVIDKRNRKRIMSLKKIFWCFLAGTSLSLAGCHKTNAPTPRNSSEPEKKVEQPAGPEEPVPGKGGNEGGGGSYEPGAPQPMYGVESDAQ